MCQMTDPDVEAQAVFDYFCDIPRCVFCAYKAINWACTAMQPDGRRLYFCSACIAGYADRHHFPGNHSHAMFVLIQATQKGWLADPKSIFFEGRFGGPR